VQQIRVRTQHQFGFEFLLAQLDADDDIGDRAGRQRIQRADFQVIG
jgi:hypothetical protein